MDDNAPLTKGEQVPGWKIQPGTCIKAWKRPQPTRSRYDADGAIAAVESGEESINHRTLVMADYAGLTQRRRLFERELM
ncbi:hypothetical protein SRABI83_02289 [Arthrobacter sp. Bi83]|nr:hypothetical protein [Arthrobacter sp. Bi83]CAH0217196.1 hypothetical protein SRABI83_02289 [Arthrobacter sp. Bi83]